MLAWMLLSLAAVGVHAATTPEQLAQEYMTALKNEGIGVSARYIHPDELARFKDMLMPVMLADLGKPQPQFVPNVYGPINAEQLKAMPGVDILSGLLKVVGDQLSGVKFESVDVLGTVREGEIAHVVARLKVQVEEVRLTQMDVISAKAYKGEWMLLLTGELEGLAAAFSKQQ
jgi:hypothetical protein